MAETALCHGYTLDDLHAMTRSSVAADRLMAAPACQRYDTAWAAIAEHLVAANDRPERRELIQVGWQAIYREVRDGLRQRGHRDGEREWVSGQPTMPRFVQFWGAGVTPSHEDWVVERVALTQVLTLASDLYVDALTALAVHGDYERAAAALGINYSTLTVRLSTIRQRILAAWHEGETPRQVQRTDRRVEARGKEVAASCRSGHEWTPENTHWRYRMRRGKPHKSRVCRACEAARSRERVATRAALRGDQP